MACKDVWGGTYTNSIGKMLYQIIIIRYGLFFQYLLMRNNNYVGGGIWIVAGGVWMVSEGVWMVCKYVWGCINTKSIGKELY